MDRNNLCLEFLKVGDREIRVDPYCSSTYMYINDDHVLIHPMHEEDLVEARKIYLTLVNSPLWKTLNGIDNTEKE